MEPDHQTSSKLFEVSLLVCLAVRSRDWNRARTSSSLKNCLWKMLHSSCVLLHRSEHHVLGKQLHFTECDGPIPFETSKHAPKSENTQRQAVAVSD